MKLKRLFASVLLATSMFSVQTNNAFAADSTQRLGCGGGFGMIGDILCKLSGTDSKADAVVVGTQTNKAISGLIGFLTVVAGLWFGIQMILGGYDWLSSGGDKGKLETARNKIVYAIIGMVVVVGSYIIIGLIGTLLGIRIFNPGQMLIDIIKQP